MKAIKLFVLVLVLIVVVVVGGAVAFIVFADPNDFRDFVAEKVKQETGRTLAIEGDLEWGFWPKLRLKTGALSLSNAEGFGEEPFLAAQEVQVAVATLPLLKKTIEMDTVRLHGVQLNLAKNSDGVTNWSDFSKGEAEKEHKPVGITSLALGGVDIQDAKISWRDAATGQDVRISKLNVSTGALTFGEPVAFKLSLNAVANQPAIDGDAALEGTVAYDTGDEHYTIEPLALDVLLRGKHLPGGKAAIKGAAAVDVHLEDGTARIDGLIVEGLDTKLTGSLAASDIESDRPSAKGQLELDGKDLALPFKVLELPVAGQLGQVKDRSFQFATDFDANMDTGEVRVSKFDGRVLGATVTGRLEARKANTDEPTAKGNLNAKGPDLPSLLAVLGQLQGADAEMLKSLNQALAKSKDKSFAVETELDADLAAGRVDLPKLSARVLGNTITGTLNATNAGAGKKPAVKGRLKADGPDMPSLLAVLAQFQGADSKTLTSLDKALSTTKDRSFTVDAELDADLGKGRVDLPKLSARILGNTITGTLQATNTNEEKPALKGQIKANGPDLPSLLAVVAAVQSNPSMGDMARSLASANDKSFTVETSFDTDLKQGSINLPALSAKGLGLTIDGKLKGQNIDSPKGAIDGRLALKGDRLGPLLTAVGQKDLADAVKAIDLDAGLTGSVSDLTLSPLALTAQVAGAGVEKPVQMKLTAGSARANLDKETLAVKDLSLTGLGINAKGNIDATKIKTEPAFSGALAVPPFNLRSVMNSLNKKLPPMADNKALTNVGVTSAFKGTSKSIALSGLTLKLDETTMKGDLAIADFEGPDVSFGLGVDAMNADRYLAPKGAGKKPPPAPEAAAGAATELPVETLRALKIKGDLLIGTLQISGAKMKNVKFSINAANGKIQVNPIAAELYQGSYNGVINLDATQKSPTLGIKTNLAKVNVEPLIVDTTGDNKLAGIVDFNANMNAIGGDGDRIKKSLTGQGKFATNNGIFRGVDAVAILKAAETIIETKRPVPIPKGGETRFQSLTGTLVAQSGVIKVDDLLLDGEGFKVLGKGTLANLHNDEVKYDMQLVVDEQAKGEEISYNLGGYAIPIKCRGNIADPSCLPDFGDLLENMVKKAATKKIEEKLKDVIPEEAGEALKKLFKF